MNGVLPLVVLERRLNPLPDIRVIMSLFEDGEYVAMFLDLVEEYLPEHKTAIMAFEYNEDRIVGFFEHFSEKYFPIDDSYVQSIYEGGDEEDSLFNGLLSFIPVEGHGFSTSYYHEFASMQRGFQLALSLVEFKFKEPQCSHGFYGGTGKGARVPLLEEVEKLVGKDVVNKIPEKGWKPEYIRQIVKDTKFAGMVDFVDWMERKTGSYFLDLDPDYSMDDPLEWDMETVTRLTNEHLIGEAIRDRMEALYAMLEEAPEKNFGELVDRLVKGARSERKK